MITAPNVITLHKPAPAITVAANPQIFTVELVQRLCLLNRQVRWLRGYKFAILAVHLRGPRPILVVSADAGPFLTAAGGGKTTVRRIGSAPVHSVLIDGIKLEWHGEEPE
jgi:hypothetical protein